MLLIHQRNALFVSFAVDIQIEFDESLTHEALRACCGLPTSLRSVVSPHQEMGANT